MRILKILLLALLLLPLTVNAQTKKKKSTGAAKPKTEQAAPKVDKYPNFDSKKAADYWKRWMRKEAFTQEDCAGVIELCSAAYDYLNVELAAIIDNYSNPDVRIEKAQNLQDTDKSGEMNTFVRSFSIRMQELGSKKMLDPELIIQCNDMTAKKKENRRLVDIIFH